MKNTKSKPKLALLNLLKRRDMTLASFLKENGITTYATLLNRCDNIGVEPPTKEKFDDAVGRRVVSSPCEGVVVVVPPHVDDENAEFPVAESQKKPRRKKIVDEQSIDGDAADVKGT